MGASFWTIQHRAFIAPLKWSTFVSRTYVCSLKRRREEEEKAHKKNNGFHLDCRNDPPAPAFCYCITLKSHSINLFFFFFFLLCIKSQFKPKCRSLHCASEIWPFTWDDVKSFAQTTIILHEIVFFLSSLIVLTCVQSPAEVHCYGALNLNKKNCKTSIGHAHIHSTKFWSGLQKLYEEC